MISSNIICDRILVIMVGERAMLRSSSGVCPKTNKIGETIWLDTYLNIINDRVDVLIANANR